MENDEDSGKIMSFAAFAIVFTYSIILLTYLFRLYLLNNTNCDLEIG